MLNMTSWEVLEADVLDDLRLDPQNVRLGTEVTAPEVDIMADLFRNEKALTLVESIVRVGYLTHEVPIVLRRKGKLIVAEGNRRVAALKAIQNPYLIPEYQARITALAAELPDRRLLRRIEVKRAPNQAAADQLIAALHTGDTRVRWSPARQAAFFEAQIEQGKTLPQLRAQYPTISVDKYVLRSGILRLFKSVSYADPAHADLLSARGSVSTLARIYESRPFTELTGLRMDEAGDIQLKISEQLFAEMAVEIVEGIADGNINTRTIGTTSSPRYLKLMDELRAIEAASQGRTAPGRPGANQAATKPPPTSPDKSDVSSPGRRTIKPSAFLDIGSLRVPSHFPDAVKVLLNELSAINVERFPNATFDLMRTFLEKSIKAAAESRGVDLRPAGHQGYVYLRNCLQWLQADAETNGPKHLIQVLKQMQSSKVLDYAGSSDFLNALNHNHHVSVSAVEVRHSWGQMKSILAEVLK